MIEKINKLICDREAIKTLSSLGGNEASNVELLASYLKFRYENYNGIIAFTPDSYQDFKFKRNVKETSKHVTSIYNYVKENFVQDNANYIDGFTFHLTQMPTKAEVAAAVNLVNKTHPIYDAIEAVMDKFPGFLCGNILEFCTESEIKIIVDTIDFKFTTLQNVMLLADCIYLNRDTANKLSENYHIGMLTGEGGQKFYRVVSNSEVIGDFEFDELTRLYNCGDFKE